MSSFEHRANPGKQLEVRADDQAYSCLPVKTAVITSKDNIQDVVNTYLTPIVEKDDIVFFSEKMIACIQGRAIHIDDIKPGFWARLLSKHVQKTPHGDGLGTPKAMQCAVDECGLPKILLASVGSVVGKVLGKRGWFYEIAGPKITAIDPPWEGTIPPFNEYVILGPENPTEEAEKISKQLDGVKVLIVDVNDLGGVILGSSDATIDDQKVLSLLKQNPLGQESQSTPIGILRPIL